MDTDDQRPGGIRTFSPEDIERMRREMFEQYAPATEMPEPKRPVGKGKLVRYDDDGD